jgi:hypothetical protein
LQDIIISIASAIAAALLREQRANEKTAPVSFNPDTRNSEN